MDLDECVCFWDWANFQMKSVFAVCTFSEAGAGLGFVSPVLKDVVS